MKLKQSPEDFQVEEITEVIAARAGPFALYRLEKKGWTTPEAVQAIRRRWKLDARRVSYGGLKDRHAHTIQYFTVYRGPQRRLTHHDVQVEYLGQVTAPFTARDIRGNRFRLILRALDSAEKELALAALEEVRRDGLPNYFDDQRFGSLSPGGGFVAREIVRGQYQEALRLALVAPYAHDRAAQKREKRILEECWGDWAACKERLPRGHARSLADYLAHHNGDYRGALERLRPELRGLYLSAYQSALWNRMLANWLESTYRPGQLLRVLLRAGPVPMHRNLHDEQRAALANLCLPLLSARIALEPADPVAPLVDAVLAEEGLEIAQLKLKGFRNLFFSKGQRAGMCAPIGLAAAASTDENHAGRDKLILSFELPRGCYATLLVKRITARGQI